MLGLSIQGVLWMERCEACKALLGKSVAINPHRDLSLEETDARDDGEVQYFRCRICKTQWQRHTQPERPPASVKRRVWQVRGIVGSFLTRPRGRC